MSVKIADITALTFNPTTHDLTLTATLYAPTGAAITPVYQDSIAGYQYDLYVQFVQARVAPTNYSANSGKQPSDPTWATTPNETDVADFLCAYTMPRLWDGPPAPAPTTETPPPFTL